MKRGLTKAVGLLFYLLMILYLMEFHVKELFEWRSFLLVVLGMGLLSLPGWIEERNVGNLRDMISQNALYASYIVAVMLLTGTLSEGIRMEDMSKALAVGIRPILYGLLFYVFFHRSQSLSKVEAKEEPQEENAKVSQTPEQVYYQFRASGLTEREAEVARLLYLDYTNRMIAEELYISEATVKKHVTHIFEKLEIESRSEIKKFGNCSVGE